MVAEAVGHALDDLASRGLRFRRIRLIDAHPIHDLPSEAGDDMEQVIDDLSLWTVLTDFQVEGGVMSMATASMRRQPSSPNSSKKRRIASRLLPAPTQRTRIVWASITTVA